MVANMMLRSDDGVRPGLDVPITATTVGRLRPRPQTVAVVIEALEGAGFEILQRPGPRGGLTIGCRGSKDLFERYFGVALDLGPDGSYVVRPRRRRRPPADATGDPDPTNVPLDRLPASLRRIVSTVALESVVSLDADVGAGDTEFFGDISGGVFDVEPDRGARTDGD